MATSIQFFSTDKDNLEPFLDKAKVKYTKRLTKSAVYVSGITSVLMK